MLSAESHLPDRMSDFFTRQINYYEHVLSELKSIEHDLDHSDLSLLNDREKDRIRVREELEREFSALSREWDQADNIPDDKRAEVYSLAERAETLAAELALEYEKAAELTNANSVEVREFLKDISKGRDLLKKYRAGDADKATFIDRKV